MIGSWNIIFSVFPFTLILLLLPFAVYMYLKDIYYTSPIFLFLRTQKAMESRWKSILSCNYSDAKTSNQKKKKHPSE